MTMTIDTLVVLDELPDGTCVAYPVVEPELAAIGSEGDVLAELRLFLSDLLGTAPPERVARFALPATSEARRFSVKLPELELPLRLRREPTVPFDVLVVPHERASWVIVPALRHVVYVGANEPLEETVTHELRRHLGALSPDPATRLALLPSTETRIVPLRLFVDREGDAERAAKQHAQLVAARARKDALELLAQVATPLHDGAHLAGPPVVGRDALVSTLDGLLAGTERRSVLLVGPERVGKSALLRAWLRGPGEGRRAFATSGAQLMAGMSGLGQWQERLRRVLDAVERLDALLVFDDLADLFDQSGSGSVDLPAAIRPALEEGRVRVVGELDEVSADLLTSRYEGFFQSFHTLPVPPLDRTQAAALLEARAAHASAEGRAEVDAEARAAMLALCERYLPYRPFPGKAAELFDDVLASVERHGVAATEHDRVRASTVYARFSAQTGIPDALLRDDRPLDPERLRARFAARLIGQAPARDAVVEALCVVKAALAPGDKPLATLLFVGPTGVGKTELARALAEVLFGAEERLVRFDMSEYADGHAARRLVEADDGGEGLLTRKVREQPFAVILLDEIEKAHPLVFDLLLQITGEGRLTDGRGRTAYFHNALLILTSNLGASHGSRRVGIAAREDSEGAYLDAVRRAFRPELVGRLDRVVPFSALSPEDIAEVARLTVDRVVARRGLRDRGVAVEVSELALARLAAEGFDPVYGARALRRHVEDRFTAPLAATLSSLGARARTMRLRVRDESEPAASSPALVRAAGGLVVEALPVESGGRRDDLRTLEAASTLRREVLEALDRPAVEPLVEEVGSLVAQLAAPRSKKEHARAGSEIAALQTRLHQLGQPWERVRAARDEIFELEELTFSSWIEVERGGEALELDAELASARLQFRQNLLAFLLERRARHAITVRCEELDEGRTLDQWIGPLLGDLARRGWTATFHLFKDPSPSKAAWPAERPYGPPRDAAWMAEYLSRPVRDRLVTLMHVRGPHAGTLVAHEAGLHRYLGVTPKLDGAHHEIHVLAFRELREAEWTHAKAQPTRPGSSRDLLRQSSRRWTDERPGQKLPDDYIHIPLSAYWSPESVDEMALREILAADEPETLYPTVFGEDR
ncbi:MAG: AAA family ATPase [Myxococcales bacterium]|nr:AAA family ATPase [Myxococcales bacterium]